MAQDLKINENVICSINGRDYYYKIIRETKCFYFFKTLKKKMIDSKYDILRETKKYEIINETQDNIIKIYKNKIYKIKKIEDNEIISTVIDYSN